MLKHQKVCVYADEAFAKQSLFCLFDDLSSSLFADEFDVSFWRVCGQEVSSEAGNLDFLELGIGDYDVCLKMLSDFEADRMFSEGSHGDEDKFFVFVFGDDFDHFFGDVVFGIEVEDLVAVSVVEDHLIDVQWDCLHFLDDLLFGVVEPFLKGEKNGILLNHLVVVPEIPGEKDGSHEALKEYHGWTRDMFGIKEVENDFELIFVNLEFYGLVVVMAVNVLDFGVLVEDELFCLMGAMNLAVVPEGGKSFVMVGVEMGQEVNEGTFGKGFGKVEVVD